MENDKDRVVEEQQGEANAQEETATKTELEELQEENERLRNEANELLDKYRRTLADFSNYRKRQDRDRAQQTTHITMDVLRRFLPILDDLDLALKNVPAEYAEQGWVEGVVLIKRKMDGLLDEYNVEPIEAVGKPFDPNYHSALLQEESEEYPAGMVMGELQRGYKLDDLILRPTLVQVSTGPGTGETSPTNEQE